MLVLKILIRSDDSEESAEANISSGSAKFLHLADELIEAFVENLVKLGFPCSTVSTENLIAMDMAEFCLELMGVALIKLWQPSPTALAEDQMEARKLKS